MAWETTNPVTFNRLGRVDDWNKLWNNADYIATDVLHLTTPGTTDVIGGDGTPATFKLLRGISASNAVIDVEGSAAELSLAGGAVTATGAGLDSNIVLQSSGSGAAYAARLRLADLGSHEFRIQDSTGAELYAFNEDRMVLGTSTIWSEDEDTKLQINAGLGSNSSYLNLKAKNVTTGVPGAATMVMSHFDATITGFHGRFTKIGGAAGTLISWEFDIDSFSFMNANDNTDSIDFTPSTAKAEGFVNGTSSWVIQNGDFRVGQTANNYVLWDEDVVEFRGFNSGAARWRMQEFGLTFQSGATVRSNYSSASFMVTDTSGNNGFGFDSSNDHLTWVTSTGSSADTDEVWIEIISTVPNLVYADGTDEWRIPFVVVP